MELQKAIVFLGKSRDALRGFPKAIREDVGYQLYRVQCGLRPTDFKPMPAVGKGVEEIRVRDAAGTYRVIYLARLSDAVYVLHCFQKKTQKTVQRDIDLAAERLRDLLTRKRG